MATEEATNEQWYDSEIEPALLALAERCKERGVSLVSVAEYDPGERGVIYQLTENAGLPIVMLKLCAMSGGNLDGYIIELTRYCKKRGIDTSASLFMQGPVEPTVRQNTERAKRAAAVLANRGWSVTESDGVSCHKCGADLMRDARYCYQCGEPVRNFTRSTIDDLEAAIAAAVDGAA